MVMNNPRIDVVNRPGIMLPPGFSPEEPKENLPTEDVSHAPFEPQEEKKVDPLEEVHKKEDEEMLSLFEKFQHAKSDSLGWVQKDEVTIAKKRIREILGFDPPPMAGYYMAVVIHEEKTARINGRKTNIILGDSTIGEEKYRNCVGLVVAQGNESYLGDRFSEHWFKRLLRVPFNKWMKPNMKKPWCRVGDWVVFPRHEGQLVNYRGVPLMMLPDVRIYTPIENPEYVTRF